MLRCNTGCPTSYRNIILQIKQPSQNKYTELQYRFAVISGAPSMAREILFCSYLCINKNVHKTVVCARASHHFGQPCPLNPNCIGIKYSYSGRGQNRPFLSTCCDLLICHKYFFLNRKFRYLS